MLRIILAKFITEKEIFNETESMNYRIEITLRFAEPRTGSDRTVVGDSFYSRLQLHTYPMRIYCVMLVL